ncbi:MAG: hypothetical protein U0L59_07035 [Faecalimonas sp.]|nr:hypothetical protein [Faecalimonas sp.]
MKKTNKIVIGWLVGIVLVSLLTGCGSDKKKAMETIEKYMNAWAANDMTTMYECYDPDLQAASEGLTNSIAGYFGIENGYSTGLALGGLFQNAFQDAAGLSVDYELVKVQESEFEKNDGHVDAKYKATVEFEKYDASVDLEILYKFDMVKRDDNWYIKNVVEEQIESDEEIQERVQKFVEEVNKNKVDKAKKEGLSQPTKQARAFSDGKAWVSGEEIGASWVCINTKGEILFSLERGMKPGTDFSNGAALIFNYNGSQIKKFQLINDKGQEIANLDGYDFKENVGEPFLLWKNIDTFEGKWTEIGFMDSKGKWTIPLTKEHAFISEDEISDYLRYCGNGVYASSDGNYEYICFSAKTGELYNINDYPYYSDGYVVINHLQEDGSCKVAIIDELGNYQSTGIVADLSVTGAYAPHGKYAEGMYFDRNAKKFYDANMNVKIDFTQYDIEKNFYNQLPCFVDGYAAIQFENDYFTIIDKDGNFMFEPIKANSSSNISEGIVGYCSSNEEGKTTWYYIDMKGNVLFEGAYGALEFHDGCALVESKEGYYYINKKGERLY